MLRISVQEQPDIRITLEGKLAYAWVNELRDVCEDVLSRSLSKDVCVELADVSFVDAAGKALLTELSRQGVGLVSDDAAMQALVEEIGESTVCSWEWAR
jgi:ABC-type transporter Mla MlaB component